MKALIQNYFGEKVLFKSRKESNVEQYDVSVLLISYNQQDYIRDAIKSIRYKHKDRLEVIFIDASSNDDSFNIGIDCLERSEFDFLAIKTNQTYLGAVNLNYGVLLSNGIWITFLAADDLFKYDKLDIVCESSENINNYDVVIGYHSDIDKKGNLIWEGYLPDFVNSYERRCLYKKMLIGELHFQYLGWIFRKSIFPKIGFFRGYTEDQDFSLRIIQSELPILYLNKSMGFHRQTRDEYSKSFLRYATTSLIYTINKNVDRYFDRLLAKSNIYFYRSFVHFNFKDNIYGLKILFKSFVYHPFGFFSFFFKKVNSKVK